MTRMSGPFWSELWKSAALRHIFLKFHTFLLFSSESYTPVIKSALESSYGARTSVLFRPALRRRRSQTRLDLVEIKFMMKRENCANWKHFQIAQNSSQRSRMINLPYFHRFHRMPAHPAWFLCELYDDLGIEYRPLRTAEWTAVHLYLGFHRITSFLCPIQPGGGSFWIRSTAAFLLCRCFCVVPFS